MKIYIVSNYSPGTKLLCYLFKLALIYGVSSQFMLHFAVLFFIANSADAASISFIVCAHPKHKKIYQKLLVFLRWNSFYSVYSLYVSCCFEPYMSGFNCGDAACGGEANFCAVLFLDTNTDVASISYPVLTPAKHKYQNYIIRKK